MILPCGSSAIAIKHLHTVAWFTIAVQQQSSVHKLPAYLEIYEVFPLYTMTVTVVSILLYITFHIISVLQGATTPNFCSSCWAAFISASHLDLLKSPVSRPQVFATYTVALYLPPTLSTSKWGLGFPWSLQYFSNCSLGLPPPPALVGGGLLSQLGRFTCSLVLAVLGEWVHPNNDSSNLWVDFLPLVIVLCTGCGQVATNVDQYHRFFFLIHLPPDALELVLCLDNVTGRPNYE